MQFPTNLALVGLIVAGIGCHTEATVPNAIGAAGSQSTVGGSAAPPSTGATPAGTNVAAAGIGTSAAGSGVANAGIGVVAAGSPSLDAPSGGVRGAAGVGVVSVAGAGAAGSAAVAGAGGASALVPSGLPDITYTLDVSVPAGDELLECKYVTFPADRGDIAVPGIESHFTPGSHHMEAFRTDLTTIPSDQADVWNCTDGGWFLHARGVFYEAQQPDSHRELPPGVAQEFKPGEIFLLQSHYVNTTGADVNAHVTFTMHTMDIKNVTSEAGSILFANTHISLAPHSKVRVTLTCPLSQDIHPAELWSHMHKQGINFVATSSDTTAAAALGASLYTNTDWSEPQPRAYPYAPPVTLHSGSSITFSCDFDNDTDRTITYGDSALTDEMCIFHGQYWPRMPAESEGCYDGKASTTAL